MHIIKYVQVSSSRVHTVEGRHAYGAVCQRIANKAPVLNVTSMKSEENATGFRSFHVLGR